MKGFVAAVILVCIATPARAQFPIGGGDDDSDFTFNAMYPKIYYTSADGLAVGGYYGLIHEMRFEDFASAAPYRAAFSANVEITTEGSGFARLEARAPFVADGWRFVGRAEAKRRANDNYFGLGNATEFDEDNVTDQQPDFYRAIHTRFEVRLEAQRRIVGGLRFLTGINVDRWRLEPGDGVSVLAQDLAAGVDPTIGQFSWDVSGRVGLVFDTRNAENAPRSGVVIEAILAGASADFLGDESYTRTTVSARGYLPVTSRVTLAGRVLGQGMTGSPRLGSLYTIAGSDRDFIGLGGPNSHRAIPDNRKLGRHKLLANAEVWYALYPFPQVNLIGFVDAGRVLEGEDFRITLEDFDVGGGVGLMVNAGLLVAGFTSGVGPDGVVLNAHTRWPF